MKNSRLEVLLWMFLGHLWLIFIIFPLFSLKGFDKQEFNISFWILFVPFLSHATRLFDFLTTFPEPIEVFSFSRKRIFIFFALITSVLLVKAINPYLVNFEEMWFWVAIFEFSLHVYIFFVYIIAKNQKEHYS